ncbi:MAG: YckD family protein [Candidatus Dormibacteraeota bacterium]|nr:YckD family protein [Candidatus Dormibacteraeota bacterium]
MKVNRMIAFPLAGAAALAIGVAAVEAAPSPPASGSTNYAQVFVNKLAGILHLTPAQTQDALKQAQAQTVDQMLNDGKITKAQADAMKARINAGNGLDAIRPFPGGLGRFGGDRALGRDLLTAELKAVAGALHMSVADLQAQLKAGKTLANLEQANNVTDATVKAAMKSAAKGVLDKAVKAGTITQAQADAMLARADTRFGFRRGLPRPAQTPAAFFQSA